MWFRWRRRGRMCHGVSSVDGAHAHESGNRAGGAVRAILAIDENERVVRALAFANGQRDAHAEQQLQQREFEPFIVEGRAVLVVTALAIR